MTQSILDTFKGSDPYPAATPLSPDSTCMICGQLSLEAIMNAPSVSLKENDLRLDEKQWLELMNQNPPIILKISHIEFGASSCDVCDVLRQHISMQPLAVKDHVEVYRCESLSGSIQSLWLYRPGSENRLFKVTLFADEGTTAGMLFPYRPIPNSQSAKTIQDIKNWIDTCNSSHSRCSYSFSGDKIFHESPLPTRVIDVGDSGGIVRLVISNQVLARYVALSHCWGGSSHCRTTKSSLEQHKNSIQITHLTKTVQDAVYIVRKLGLRYLWVDSLCIIQDDEEDWLHEAGQMAAVYEGAYLTIAASASSDGSGGCFMDREPRELVRLPCQTADDSVDYMYLGTVDTIKEAQRVFQGPLNSRAWVLQEHLFSRRTVHFATDQVYWECDKFLMGQDRSQERGLIELKIPMRALLSCIIGDMLGPIRMPHLVKEPPQKPFLRGDFYNWWASTIRYFSKCGLTNPGDKLPALLSLSTELGKLTGDEYHEGHWNWLQGIPLFISSLLWHAEKGYMTKPPFRAPSWSWAALDGPLDFADTIGPALIFIFHPQETDMRVLKVVEFEPIGLSRRKSLLLSAVLICVSTVCLVPPPIIRTLSKCYLCDKAQDLNCVRLADENGNEITGAFTFDLKETQPSNLWLLPTHSRAVNKGRPAPVHFVLLVAEVPNQRASGMVCERVGVGHIEDAHIVFKRSRQCVVLI